MSSVAVVSRAERIAPSWLIVGAGCVTLAMLASTLTYFRMTAEGVGFSWPLTLVVQLVLWSFWGAVTPLVIRWSRRVPIIGDGWWRSVLFHAIAGSVLVALFDLLALTMSLSLGWMTQEQAWPAYTRWITTRFAFELFIYLALIAVFSAVDRERSLRERQVRTAQLETQLLAAQLASLRAQLHPHFLFNSLHTVAALVRERENDVALDVVLNLSELLRRVVDASPTDLVPLRDELDFVGRYVDIERVRFGASFSVSIDAVPEVLDALVPPLLLQPLVENALRHGARDDGSVAVIIRARRQSNTITIDVDDSGPGPADGRESGVGLANTRARLESFYGHDGCVELAARPAGGARTRVQLPVAARQQIPART